MGYAAGAWRGVKKVTLCHTHIRNTEFQTRWIPSTHNREVYASRHGPPSRGHAKRAAPKRRIRRLDPEKHETGPVKRPNA